MSRAEPPGPWEVARTAPGACAGAGGAAALAFSPAELPLVLRPADEADASDWWFRAPFRGSDAALLRLGGLATAAEVYVNGVEVLRSESMFVSHAVALEDLREGNELLICCRALAPLLSRRRSPRARWRTRLVADGNLRWWRTSLIGRAPGFSPVGPIVGPFRPVTLEPLAGPRLDQLRIRTRIDGEAGIVELAGCAVGAGELEITAGGTKARAAVGAGGAFAATLRLDAAERWWPHTHGLPALHEVVVASHGEVLARRRVGFRTLAPGPAPGHDVLKDGLDLHVNGVRVFARGAVWTHVPEDEIRGTLQHARDAGMNMIRVAGIGVYESAAFHAACDELGLLVWQDFMFANLDYPVADEAFRRLVESEAAQECARLAGHPSLAVLCGNSEVEQQVAMLGLDPALGRGELFGRLLPDAARAEGLDVPYLPSAPASPDGEMPMRTDRGVANYFGVGGYRRPPEDARRAAVRFASECLALANVAAIDPVSRTEGVPRDVGADWDFADVRDHYLALLHGVDPARLLRDDPATYYELSRAASGEVMAEALGEWRRAGSPCRGALILWLRDLVPGSGWGVLDHAGAPKPVLAHLRQVLAPVALWSTDEGLSGIALHLANDGPAPVRGTLRVTLYRDLETVVGEASRPIELGPHSGATHHVETLLGRFADAGWAHRFGPPQHDAVAGAFECEGQPPLLTVRFPAGPPAPVAATELGLRAVRDAEGVVLGSRRLVHAARILGPAAKPADGAITLEPGRERRVALPEGADGPLEVRAANLRGALAVPGIPAGAGP